MSFASFYRGKRVFVTGHTGFKGAWLSHWLLNLGADVTGYSIDIPTRPSLFEAMGLSGRLNHHIGDVRDLASFKKVFSQSNPEVVFHLAAQALVLPSYEDPVKTFSTNLLGTVHVLESIRFQDSVRSAVVVTTDKCYENFDQGRQFVETDPLGGKDPYSASKACAELAFNSYFQSFFKERNELAINSARAGNVIGGGDWSENRIVPDAMKAWSSRDSLVIRNPGFTRPWQHVLEPLGGYLELARRGDLRGEAFNFGPDPTSGRSVGDLVEELKKRWPDAQIEVSPRSPSPSSSSSKEAQTLGLDISKAEKVLKWKPSLKWEETIRLTSEWYRAFYDGSKKLGDLSDRQIEAYQESAKKLGLALAE